MSWSDRFPSLKGQTSVFAERRPEVVSVQGLCDIPPAATPLQVFRLQVEVCKVTERVTRNGDPCFFLDVRDTEGLRFPVIVWDWQMAKFRETFSEKETVVMDVRVPKEGFHAFTLA
jgi:DNA polymerase III alpha subunit